MTVLPAGWVSLGRRLLLTASPHSKTGILLKQTPGKETEHKQSRNLPFSGGLVGLLNLWSRQLEPSNRQQGHREGSTYGTVPPLPGFPWTETSLASGEKPKCKIQGV